MKKLLRNKKTKRAKNSKKLTKRSHDKKRRTLQRGGTLEYLASGAFGCAFKDKEIQNTVLKIQNYDERRLGTMQIFDEIEINKYLKSKIDSNIDLAHYICAFNESYKIKNPHLAIQSKNNSNNSNKIDKIDKIKMITECEKQGSDKQGFSSSLKYVIIKMPNCGVSLNDYIKTNYTKEGINSINGINGDLALLLIKKIIESLEKLHSIGIMHGDINAGNIVVDESECNGDNKENLRVRFIDFGYSAILNDEYYKDKNEGDNKGYDKSIANFNFKIHPILPPEYLLFKQIFNNTFYKFVIKDLLELVNLLNENNFENFLENLNKLIENEKGKVPKGFETYQRDLSKFYSENNHENMYKRDYYQLGVMLFQLFTNGEKKKRDDPIKILIDGTDDQKTQISNYIYNLTNIDYRMRNMSYEKIIEKK